MKRSELAEDIRTYLTSVGATERPPGQAGAIWTLGSQEVAVANQIQRDSREWRSAVERIAYGMQSTEADVAGAILGQFIDVADLRAAKDIVIEDSIPLEAGVQLVASARGMLRSAATTAQRVRAQIGGNYSVIGDRIAGGARLGHTKRGSYIIPVIMPLPRPNPEQTQSQPPLDLGVQRVAYEPEERRVMRTLAEALSAISRTIIEPAIDPKPQAITEAVAAGASYELLSNLRQIVSADSVAMFTASFDWGGSATSPDRIPPTIEVPHASLDLLERASRHMSIMKIPTTQTISGPIVEVRHLPEDPMGEIAIQTIRSGRPSEVRVTLRQQDMDNCLVWMKTARTVSVTGKIESQRGRPLRIRKPEHVGPLDETFLDLFRKS